ncbi:hypothetical protein L6452_31328 [Arctium lappa]|uniref:Uncharacterized protein n=1 Tax=Arctium lappa TaxID=4217 RepID=A0ACB8ZQ11_ARCLA|nr:hypothetical protein L6452_31328 [Arctium lappa]
MCPGLTLGLANLELPLAMLLYHFDWQLQNGATHFDMSEAFGATINSTMEYHIGNSTNKTYIQRWFLS